MGCKNSKSDFGNVRRVAAFPRSAEAVTMSTQDIYRVYRFDARAVGHGHFGTVRTATPINEAGKIYAVKTVSREKVKKDLQFLQRELKLLRDLDHPNIIKLHETYNNGEFIHFVMEYCSGGNLMEYVLKRSFLKEEEIAKIMTKAFSAVKYLHEKGIVHRDIKADNFLFSSKSSDAELKLIDFGLSRSIKPGEKLTTQAGTPLFIAPEVIEGKYDEKCDYWGLGVMLYFFLTKHFPYDGDTVPEIAKNILKSKASFEGKQWEGVSADAINLCKRLLERDPAKRITAAEALGHPWIKLVTKQPKLDRTLTSNIVGSLRAFTNDRRLKREILNVLLYYLNEKELKQLHEAFAYFDKDRSGSITVADLKSVIKENNIQVADDELENIISKVDLDKEHNIRYSEFMLAALDSSYYLSKERLWAAFKHFDLDNSNYITTANVREVLARAGRRIPQEEINEMIKEVDANKDGKIDFQEFCKIVKFNEYKAETPKDFDMAYITKTTTLRSSQGPGKTFFQATESTI